jgi:putative transposase
VPKDTHHTTVDRAQLQLPERVTVAVAELAGAAREGLLALAVGTGLQVLAALLAEDVARLVGPRGCYNPDRAAVRHGSEPGQVTLGGRRVRVRRPRVRTADGTRELPVPTYQAFAATDLLGELALERMLAKLSTRRYPAGLEPVEISVEQAATGTSRSAVSRRFVARTEHALAELLAQDLTGLDLVALMVDGIRVADHTCVVALGITLDGTKIPLALAEGATENARVVTEVLVGLRERGLEVTRPILVVIDGAKALTIARLSVPATLARTLRSTNSIWVVPPRAAPPSQRVRPPASIALDRGSGIPAAIGRHNKGPSGLPWCGSPALRWALCGGVAHCPHDRLSHLVYRPSAILDLLPT